MTQLNNATECPLCGQSNACQMAAGSDAPCWCMTADWLGAPGQLSAALPPGLPGNQCVCAACAKRLLQGDAPSPQAGC